jgi:hypothetical protein
MELTAFPADIHSAFSVIGQKVMSHPLDDLRVGRVVAGVRPFVENRIVPVHRACPVVRPIVEAVASVAACGYQLPNRPISRDAPHYHLK